jgi:glycosyltransferase involved in cell wall biosynthesis
MRILMSADTLGGVLTYTTELAAAFEARGDEVAVATMGGPVDEETRRRLPERLYESDFRLEWMDEPWADIAAAGDWLLELEEELRPDVVHLCSYAHGALPFRAPKVLVAHSCVLSWWRAVHGTEAPAAWDAYRAAMDHGLRGAAAIVAPSTWMLDELERDRDLSGLDRVVIHNGSAAPAAGLGEKRPLVLGAGRFWDPAKNLAALDTAAAGLEWPVVLAGDFGPGLRAVNAEATGLLPPAELAERRREAAIYAAPARYEPFGLGILEAARDRAALVLGDTGSLRELWDGAAIFVDPADPAALHEALARLIADGARRANLAARAQDRAAAYTVDRAAGAYRRLYERLAAARPRGVEA